MVGKHFARHNFIHMRECGGPWRLPGLSRGLAMNWSHARKKIKSEIERALRCHASLLQILQQVSSSLMKCLSTMWCKCMDGGGRKIPVSIFDVVLGLIVTSLFGLDSYHNLLVLLIFFQRPFIDFNERAQQLFIFHIHFK